MAYSAEWSADGSRLALTVQKSPRRFDIEVMRIDGTNQHPLLPTKADRRSATWSPDGGAIAFQRSGGIYTASSSGSRERRLITGRLGDWLPDARALAVIRRDLFRVNLRGRVEDLLLRHPPGGFFDIALSPDGRKVAFTAAVESATPTRYICSSPIVTRRACTRSAAAT
jgi:Tol biopolymer transport system component